MLSALLSAAKGFLPEQNALQQEEHAHLREPSPR